MRTLLAVAVGGLLGTALRLAADLAAPHLVATFVVNVVGSLALGFLVARLWPVAPAWLRAGLGAGLLGSFTTFSAVALGAVELTATGSGLTALGYVAASVVGGVVAAAIGLRLGARRVPPIGADE